MMHFRDPLKSAATVDLQLVGMFGSAPSPSEVVETLLIQAAVPVNVLKSANLVQSSAQIGH